jgi:two-component system nitrogen regulation response regulator GlnG
MTAHSDLDSAVESYEHGAWEYLPNPFDIDEAVSMVQRATASEDFIKEETTDTQAEVIGEAPANCSKNFLHSRGFTDSFVQRSR